MLKAANREPYHDTTSLLPQGLKYLEEHKTVPGCNLSSEVEKNHISCTGGRHEHSIFFAHELSSFNASSRLVTSGQPLMFGLNFHIRLRIHTLKGLAVPHFFASVSRYSIYLTSRQSHQATRYFICCLLANGYDTSEYSLVSASIYQHCGVFSVFAQPLRLDVTHVWIMTRSRQKAIKFLRSLICHCAGVEGQLKTHAHTRRT